MSGFWYLATPYSNYVGGLQAAFGDACREAGILIKAGVPVFCPIAHSHPIAVLGGIDPLAHAVWMAADAPFMDAAAGLIVCRLPGYSVSLGVAQEIEAFRAARKPIVFMDPGAVPEELL